MLNKNKERELAYVVRIDDLKPIEGKDRVECAVVGGWNVMVRKEQFKVGDPAIYFEIDSKVPETEPFKFLEPKHYKIKTQKYGNFYSQGLLMAAEDFGWKVGSAQFAGDAMYIEDDQGGQHFADDIESMFLTKQLGVTYYDPMDRARKSSISRPEYKPIWKKIKNRFPFKQLMRTQIGRKVLLAIFGVKKKKKNWPYFMPHSDQERCLMANTKIDTNLGKIRIGNIVNQNIDCLIKTYNLKEKRIEYKPIISRQDIGLFEDYYKITYNILPFHNRKNSIECTGDHKFYTLKGYIDAKDLKCGDKILTTSEHYPEDIIPYAYGCLLGDSHLYFDKRNPTSARIDITHGYKQLDYIKWKKQLFSIDKIFQMHSPNSYSDNIVYRIGTHSDDYITQKLYEDNAIKDYKLHITKEFCDRIDFKSLAIWYQDDGSLTYNSNFTSAFVRINSNRFTNEENKLLCERINELCKTEAKVSQDKKGFYYIYIRSSETEKFIKCIAEYIHPVMRYKVLSEYLEIPFSIGNLKFKQKELPIWNSVKGIEKISYHAHKYGNKHVYDITVADNHNFFANGILTHNCQNMKWILENKTPFIATEKVDGCSSGFTVCKGKFGKLEYCVCSRNVVLTRNQKTYYDDMNVWYEMYDKYNIKDFLTDFIKETKADWVYLQGESYGDGIQKRTYGLKGHDFRAFELCTSNRCRYTYVEMKEILDKYDIPTVPILNENYILPDTVEELINYAHGNSEIDGDLREGIVLQNVEDSTISFKAVDPEFLTKYH